MIYEYVVKARIKSSIYNVFPSNAHLYHIRITNSALSRSCGTLPVRCPTVSHCVPLCPTVSHCVPLRVCNVDGSASAPRPLRPLHPPHHFFSHSKCNLHPHRPSPPHNSAHNKSSPSMPPSPQNNASRSSPATSKERACALAAGDMGMPPLRAPLPERLRMLRPPLLCGELNASV